MKKHCYGKLPALLLVLFSFLVTNTLFAQGYNTTDWRYSNPKQFGFTVLDVDFFDNNNVIAVGGDGGIARSTDGGVNWTYGPFTFVNTAGVLQKQTFNDVHYVTSTVAYAVGSLGAMAKTTDGGATWSLVQTPLFGGGRSVNAVWFLNANTGYIGGTWNTADSIPKLYFTNNGGATWDSMNAPLGGKTRVGYINNPNLPPLIWDVTAKAKEIYRIEFTSPTTGYITGSGSSEFPRFPSSNAAPACTPTGTTTTTGSHNASLVWKFQNGVLTDYSLSKERLGYSGINTNTITCTTTFGNITPMVQQYRAINIINDSLVVMISFNNNTIIRVHTGRNDSTLNMATNLRERGRYEIMSYPFPPTQGPQAGPPIPNPNNNLFSNPYQIRRDASGRLFAAANFGRLWMSSDTGRNWTVTYSLPPTANFSGFATWALDIAPNGQMITMGQNGVVARSTSPANMAASNYSLQAVGAYVKINFADCNNGMAVGGASLAQTFDGGTNWREIVRSDFQSLNIFINSFEYVNNNPAQAYIATSVGNIYKSTNLTAANPALDPVLAVSGYQMWDVATAGNDSVWACGYTLTPNTAQTSRIYRSTNGGTTWTPSNFPIGTGTNNFLLRFIEFPTRMVGYAAGNRDTIWKTTDGGVTWNKLPLPTPGVTPQITYTDMFAPDPFTIYLTGNGFPRKVVFRSTDGGFTWQDISSNITSIYPVGNMNGVLFHDANNGYVVGPGGALLRTNNGGASWSLSIAPTSNLFSTMAFAPERVPAGTPVANRKLFVTGPALPNNAGHILEYGNLANLNVASNENIATSCSNASNGTVTVTPSGGIAPYTYSIDGGAFQASNSFSNVSGGAHTISIRDAACGTLTKTIVVGTRLAPFAAAGPDVTILEGEQTQLLGNASATAASIVWSPSVSVILNSNTATPVVKPGTTTNYQITVTDANGCISSDNALVTVIPYCLKVMDAFTPNGDGQNDRWIVTNNGGNCVEQVYVTVFNRYGNIVYKNDNYQNNWDGTYSGKPVPDATYYYAISYRLISGKTVTLKGDVTILR